MDRYDKRKQLAESADKTDRIVAAIWDDVTDRRGWRQEADNFDEDVCLEIMATWANIIRTA